MTHIIKIQNLSSGDVVVFQNTLIQSYNFKKILNWESTNTIGRMDPVKTFKNTDSKIDTAFTVINPHLNILHHKMTESKLSYETEGHIEAFFQDPKVDTVRAGVYSYDSNINVISKLLYPSYERSPESDALYMKSAPVLRVSIYVSSNEEIKIFDGYATINALDTNFKAEDVSAPSGRAFSSLEFSILFDVLHTNETDISSRQEVIKITQEDVTSPQTEKKVAGPSTPTRRAETLNRLTSGVENAGGLDWRSTNPATPSILDKYYNNSLNQWK